MSEPTREERPILRSVGQRKNGEWCYDHDWQPFIDPRSGGFVRCSHCGKEQDCEDPDGDLG